MEAVEKEHPAAACWSGGPEMVFFPAPSDFIRLIRPSKLEYLRLLGAVSSLDDHQLS